MDLDFKINIRNDVSGTSLCPPHIISDFDKKQILLIRKQKETNIKL